MYSDEAGVMNTYDGISKIGIVNPNTPSASPAGMWQGMKLGGCTKLSLIRIF